ncbi:2-oxoacid:acceptor oxidoreductase family protein [Mesobacillus zeae]|uniref:2-oxoacid:ferredoxin oxidoreductase subunit gamma n=1 Tax=Mesobacillus zeae TaxID=1917180 RepID=A0A398B9X2_9BACI|nr:2-oxoacid:acceptor oxidoreductase family protein [Mesobacillus zeae]RID84690.1 2-oxoacid:ferredoxin oxidoreductase subunit gamma [Mesobacillus zeae]
MMEEIIIAGFGGQGVMSMGQLLAYAGMAEGKFVSWLPSYGPEQRGGTANCTVVLSKEPIGSPLVSNPATAIVMNAPSFDKFEPKVKPGGLLIVNTSMADRKSMRTDIHTIYIKATDMAGRLGSPKSANMVLLGALLAYLPIVSEEAIIQSLEKVLSPGKQHLLKLNEEALKLGKSHLISSETARS